MNDWLTALGRRLVEAAFRRQAAIDPPELDPDVAAEILDLARVAAHTQERRFAPLASFMAGVAVERMRHARAALSSADLVAYLHEVRESLEKESADLSQQVRYRAGCRCSRSRGLLERGAMALASCNRRASRRYSATPRIGGWRAVASS